MTFADRMAALDPRRSWTGYLLAAGAALSLAFAALAPAASDGIGPAGRIGFWLAHVFAALAALSAAQLALGRLPRMATLSPWAQVAAAGACGAVLFAPVALALDAVLAPAGATAADDAGILRGMVDEFASFAAPMSLSWMLLNAPRLVRIGAEAAQAQDDAPDNAPDDAPNAPARDAAEALWSRLPRRLGRDLVAMSAELHYLRVHTARGEALVLMSFGRALEAVAALQGMAIHRSHWVALPHVAEIEADGSRSVCVLDTGLRLPVSRPNRAALRAALKAAAPVG